MIQCCWFKWNWTINKALKPNLKYTGWPKKTGFSDRAGVYLWIKLLRLSH